MSNPPLRNQGPYGSWRDGGIAQPPSGGDNGDMEARVAKLEAVAEHTQRELSDIKSIVRGHDAKFDSMRDRQERDFRILFGALIAVALGLAGLMAKGFHWL